MKNALFNKLVVFYLAQVRYYSASASVNSYL